MNTQTPPQGRRQILRVQMEFWLIAVRTWEQIILKKRWDRAAWSSHKDQWHKATATSNGARFTGMHALQIILRSSWALWECAFKPLSHIGSCHRWALRWSLGAWGTRGGGSCLTETFLGRCEDISYFTQFLPSWNIIVHYKSVLMLLNLMKKMFIFLISAH